jgi:F-type H+-transporting ATPase subunit epsilon
MENTFQLELLTPEKIVFSGTVVEVIAPGREGYFGIQAGHLYFSTTLKKGILTAKQKDESKQYLLDGGIIQVTPEKVVVCAENAFLKQEKIR